MYQRSLLLFIVILLLGASEKFAQESEEIDKEITRLKNELHRVRSQRKEEMLQTKREQDEFNGYRKRTEEKIAAIRLQTDSIKAQSGQIRQNNDSIAAYLTSLQTMLREQDLKRDRMRAVIRASSENLLQSVDGFPPLLRQQFEGPVKYLMSEVEAHSVDNTEALYRLMRMVQDLRTSAQEIQVVEGVSPVSQLRGTVFRLRIGAVFEAVVDMNGARAFLWKKSGTESNSPQWTECSKQEYVRAIADAVRMREGKSVPELISLPFGPYAIDAEDGNDGK